eukprot:NODE_102_length_20354_cov_0.272018.p10 type:complete len:136 gc:universal NODE_102_length_20354_cov_0.272018:336-743(+)
MISRFIYLFLPDQGRFLGKILGGFPITTINYAMIYFYRTRGKFTLEYNNYHIFIACIVLADKFVNDYCIKNLHYAANCHINLNFLNFLEGWVMRFMDYSFRVHSSELMVLQKMLTKKSQMLRSNSKMYDHEIITI